MSNHFFQLNLSVLAQAKPDVFSVLRAFAEKNRVGSAVLEKISEHGYRCQWHGTTYAFHEMTTADLNARKTLYVCHGIGTGEFIRFIRSHQQNNKVLVHEPDPALFWAFLQIADFQNLLADPDVHFVIGELREEITPQIHQFFSMHPQSLALVFHCQSHSVLKGELRPQWQKACTDFHAEFHAVIEQKLQRLKPNEEDAFWGLLNTTRNAAECYEWPSLESFGNCMTGKPAILVGTGPSLKHTLPFIKKMRQKVVVMACDSALKVLLAEGITPDFVASIERLGQSRFLFEGMPELKNTPLLTPSLMSGLAISAYRGPKIFVSVGHGFDDWLIDGLQQEATIAMPGVSHLAYLGLRRMGCDPIYLFGQDLAHDPFSHHSHIDSAASYIHQAEKDLIETGDEYSQIIQIKGYDGHAQKTNSYWRHFAQGFSALQSCYGGLIVNVLPDGYGIEVPGAQKVSPETFESMMEKDSVCVSEVIAQKLMDTSEKKIAEIRNRTKESLISLRDLQKKSVELMAILATSWMDYNPLIQGHGTETHYGKLFPMLDAEWEKMTATSFWKNQFNKLVSNSFLGLQIEKAQCEMGTQSTMTTINNLIQIHYRLFNLVQLWSARAIDALEKLYSQLVQK